MNDNVKELFEAAKKVRQNSHSPYSKFAVGAAVRAKSGKIYFGCNVENSSYGSSNCAERTAIYTAVSAGEKEITEVMIVTDHTPPTPPCGHCRQVISEFADKSIPVYSAGLDGKTKGYKLEEILPSEFNRDYLP